MTSPSRSIPRWFRVFAFGLLLVQGVLACTWVLEGVQGIGWGAHVESPASATHHAHDEAECPSCAGRSIQASAPELARSQRVSACTHRVQVLASCDAPPGRYDSVHTSRAPPGRAVGPVL